MFIRQQGELIALVESAGPILVSEQSKNHALTPLPRIYHDTRAIAACSYERTILFQSNIQVRDGNLMGRPMGGPVGSMIRMGLSMGCIMGSPNTYGISHWVSESHGASHCPSNVPWDYERSMEYVCVILTIPWAIITILWDDL